MPPRTSRRSPVMTCSQSESEKEQSSQEQIAEDMLKTARDMVTSSKRRRIAKRKAIEEEHQKQTKDIAARINALFEKRKNRVAKLQKAQWDRLANIVKRRSALEAQILGSMKSIEMHTVNIGIELSAIFDERIKEIQDTPSLEKA